VQRPVSFGVALAGLEGRLQTLAQLVTGDAVGVGAVRQVDGLSLGEQDLDQPPPIGRAAGAGDPECDGHASRLAVTVAARQERRAQAVMRPPRPLYSPVSQLETGLRNQRVVRMLPIVSKPNSCVEAVNIGRLDALTTVS